MNNQQSGMVLLTTMMMIVILTLLVLSLMQGVFLYIKSCNQVMANHHVFHQMEGIANTLDLANAACVVWDKNPNQLVDMLLANQGCVVVDGTRQYRYVLEDLGLYPCLQILMDEFMHGSHHWLVTLASMQPPNIILQMRMARPFVTDRCESSSSQRIYSGIVSWRKLGGLDRNSMRVKIFG